MNQETFKQLIRRILTEEVEKSGTDQKIYQRVPEVTHDEDYKKIVPHATETKSKEALLDDITKVVKDINTMFTVIWDDNDDIAIEGKGLFRIRICPRWENNYNIEAFINNNRIYITGQHWDQVKKFLRDNLKGLDTAKDVAYEKVAKSREDATAKAGSGLPQKDKPKILPLTNEPPKEVKTKDKTHTEKQTKNEEDLPEKPMRAVGEFKTQLSHKVKDPVKLRKRKPDTKLVIKQS